MMKDISDSKRINSLIVSELKKERESKIEETKVAEPQPMHVEKYSDTCTVSLYMP